MKKVFLLIFVLLLILSLEACDRNKSVTTVNRAAQSGGYAPDFELKDINGKAIKLSEFKGNVVLLEFWATWCPPCRSSVPDLVALQEKYKNKGVRVLGISLDEDRDLPIKLAEFSKEFKINYPILIGNEYVTRAYNVKSMPTSFLINKEGKIVNVFMGYIDNFETSMSALLDKTI